MRTLSYGERSWMTTHIARGLHQLGIPVTPQAVERELGEVDAAVLRAADAEPPDAYRAQIDALRSDVTATRPFPATSRPTPALDANGVPDPYAADIAKLKETR